MQTNTLLLSQAADTGLLGSPVSAQNLEKRYAHEKLGKLLSLVLVLSMMIGTLTLNTSAASATGYTDVDADAPYAEAVQILKESGVMIGIGNNKFGPDILVTRAQAITVLGRLAGVTLVETSEFTDVVPNSWYSGYVGWAVENSIIEGDGQGKFMPEANVTSDHLDLMLSRYSQIADITYTAAGTSAKSVSRADLAQRLMVFLKDKASAIKLSAADATFQGSGLTMTGEATDIVYDADAKAVLYMDKGSSATFTVPDGVSGEYDVYLKVGKSFFTYGSTPFRLQINGEAQYIQPIVTETSASDMSDLYDMGMFQIGASKTLKAGDTLSVCAQPGYGIHSSYMNITL